MMRILLYDNTQMAVKSGRYYCAAGTGAFAKELVELGYEVTMFGQQIQDPTSASSFDIIEGGINVAGLRRFKSKIISYILLYSASIKYIIRSDFVYLFYPTSYRYLPFICKFLGKKYGLYVRGDENVESRLSKLLYKNASVVFTVAKLFTDIVNNASGKNNGFTIRPMISFTDKDVVQNRIYVPKEHYLFLFLSRLQEEKGVRYLLQAVRDLRRKGVCNFTVNIVGGGPFYDTACGLVEEYGIQDMVSMVGAINDEERKKQIYSDADVYILPTYYREGFPRTLYEAMIFGTPILTTFVSGIPSLMEDGKNCRKIEPKSVESIEKGIIFAINNYTIMGDYAHNATQTVLQVVDPKRLTHAQDVDKAIRRFGNKTDLK